MNGVKGSSGGATNAKLNQNTITNTNNMRGNINLLPVFGKPGKSVPTIYHLLRVLCVFNKLFVKNLRFRDRTVKVVQYGCQMLSGYYSDRFSSEFNEGLINLRRTTSNARKWFWLLKSIQHIDWLFKKSNPKDTATLIQKVDYIEAIFLVLYYGYENRVLFSRLKIPGFSEEKDAFWTNYTWFIGDAALLLSSCMKLHNKLFEIRELKDKLRDMKNKLEIEMEYNATPVEGLERLWLTFTDNICSLFTDTNGKQMVEVGDIDQSRMNEMEKQLKVLLKSRYGAYLQMWIGVFEVGVSAHYSGCLKNIYESRGEYLGANSKYNMSDGHIGLMGVLSSSLILYQYWRDLPNDEVLDFYTPSFPYTLF